MGATLQYLLFLYWMFRAVEANLAQTGDCGEKFLIAQEDTLAQFCPETNAKQVIAEGSFSKISYSPRNGGTIVAVRYRSQKLVTLVQTNYTNSTWTHTVMDLQSQPRPGGCYRSGPIQDLAVDSVSGIVYVTYKGCGKIRAYDLKLSLFATVYEDPNGHPYAISTASRDGFLIWLHSFIGTDEEASTLDTLSGSSTSIVRALLDGTEVKVLIPDLPRYFGENLAVDQKTSLIYWTLWGQLHRCDLQGKRKRPLNVVLSERFFTVHDNIIMYWRLRGSTVYRTVANISGEPLVYVVGATLDVEMLPRRDELEDSIENPCENNPCSHICVRSSNSMGFTCLCPDDNALERDGQSCSLVQRRLLVSTRTEGIWQIPVINGKASHPKLVVRNALNVTGVQCDPIRPALGHTYFGVKIFWAEGSSQVTKILQLDMANPEKAPDVVFKHSLTVRASHEELGAFALDFKTGNLYMAFNDEQRILACGRDNDSTKYSKCAELFGNKVGFTIGGLALDPTKRILYWTQSDEGDSEIMRGGMDGSWMETLKKRGQPKSLTIGALSIVYWWNQALERFQHFDPAVGDWRSLQRLKYKSHAPQQITVDGSSLYWAGVPKGLAGRSETIYNAKLNPEGKLEDQYRTKMYVNRLFKDVTGLWMCDADFEWAKRVKECGNGRQCAGLWLSNGTDSFRCVCPMRFESNGTKGSFCKEIEEPAIIYSKLKGTVNGSNDLMNGSIKIKNGMKETLIYMGWVSSMAFDPMRMELFWCNGASPEETNASAINGTFRLKLTNKGNEGTRAAPQPFPFEFEGLCPIQLEYDWIGENLYFVHESRGFGLCSTATGECTILNQWSKTIALDPSNGHLYWYTEDLGIWRGDMDGLAETLIIPKVQAKFLTVDHTSKLLFWFGPVSGNGVIGVSYSELNGKNVRQTIRLHADGGRIRVAGNRLWMSFRSSRLHRIGILSCDKETGDNFKTHELEQYEDVTDFLIRTPAGEIQTGRDVCILGALCSHMCIPTPSGYMRCLCPTGYKLMEDGWTCGCKDADVCNASDPGKLPLQLRPSTTHPSSKLTTQVVCKGNKFPCVGKCLDIDKLCNGIPNCEDFSDEGEGCHDACEAKQGCSHSCSRSPTGPLCFCPPDQTLEADNKSCVVLEPPHLPPFPTRPSSKETTQVVCQGNEFPCAGKCLGIDKLCNGMLDCEDFSDEGQGCNETCKDNHGCSHPHACSRSPMGPLCFCPPDQMLAADDKSCVVLKIRNELVQDGKLKVGLIVVGVLGTVLVILVTVGTLKYQQTKRERDLTQAELDEFMLGDPAEASVTPDGFERALFLPFTKVIRRDGIMIARDSMLGSGEFGIVHRGICHSEPVAIKVLKPFVEVDEFKAVLAEVKIMAYLGDHEFIVKFVGAEVSEVSKRKIMILTELSPKGDLLKYLWKVASVGLGKPPGMYVNVAENNSGVTKLTLYAWCEQIATGLEYLAQKQIVHGDLAARNVLVFKDNVVKIAGFGLSKQLHGCSTNQMKRERKLPWKWSAIELLTSREVSESSDVWAFGVTAWEIFTLGQTPYKGIMTGNEFIQYIQAGNRLPKPQNASEEIFKVFLECWDSEPRNRPNFQRLKEIFHDFVSEQRGCMQPVMNTAESINVTAV